MAPNYREMEGKPLQGQEKHEMVAEGDHLERNSIALSHMKALDTVCDRGVP